MAFAAADERGSSGVLPFILRVCGLHPLAGPGGAIWVTGIIGKPLGYVAVGGVSPGVWDLGSVTAGCFEDAGGGNREIRRGNGPGTRGNGILLVLCAKISDRDFAVKTAKKEARGEDQPAPSVL